MLPVTSHCSDQKLDVWHRSKSASSSLPVHSITQAVDRQLEGIVPRIDFLKKLGWVDLGTINSALFSPAAWHHESPWGIDKDGRYWPGEIVTPCEDDYQSDAAA